MLLEGAVDDCLLVLSKLNDLMWFSFAASSIMLVTKVQL